MFVHLSHQLVMRSTLVGMALLASAPVVVRASSLSEPMPQAQTSQKIPVLTSTTPFVDHSPNPSHSASRLNKLETNVGRKQPALTDTMPVKVAEAAIAPSNRINDDRSDADAMSQVTSVSQLSDVKPTDWAFQALQLLIERYGVIAGYPDRTYRGNRALTRYEFAAGLNAALNRVDELLAAGTADLVKKEDLATLQRLQEEFAAELATSRGRVDSLEARTATLEKQQFSTTTKLLGEAVFAVTDAFQGTQDGSNTVFQDRVRLRLVTSFTGRDQLNTRIDAGNAGRFNLGGATPETTQTFNLVAFGGNQANIGWLSYYFPVGDRIDAYIGAVNGVTFDFIPTLNPFLDSATGAGKALTVFASANPIYQIGGGAGGGFNYRVTDQITLSLGYLAGDHANPGAKSGLFNGQYAAIAQVAWFPNNRSGIGLTYVHAYQNRGGLFDIGSSFAIVGTSQANNPFGNAFISNSFGAEGYYQLSPSVAVSGFFGYTNSRDLAGNGNADIWYYGIGLAFPDLGQKGNLGGIVVGAEPYRGDNRAPANDVPFHIEAFYKYRLTDNIFITPGIIWLIAPAQNAANEDAVIGTIRTTFLF